MKPGGEPLPFFAKTSALGLEGKYMTTFENKKNTELFRKTSPLWKKFTNFEIIL